MAGAWQRMQLGLLLSASVFVAGCTRSTASAPPQIRLVPSGDRSAAAYIEVAGLSAADQRLVAAARTAEEWQRVLAVFVKRQDSADQTLPVAGNYTIDHGALRFTPLFPFDPGREYEVRFGSTTATVALLPAPALAPAYVTQVYPSRDVLPENQLRLYIHFSAAMGRRGGVDHIRLLDESGREVEMPFLPLEAEFWNADRTRYTVFFDPGRQKRGILPNRQMGPSLVEGRTYMLVIDRNWRDGNGNALRESFTRRFRVGPPELSALDLAQWRITPPPAATRNPLIVRFPKPLDHGLLLSAIGVRRAGQSIAGDVRVGSEEQEWTLTPSEPWRAGAFELIVLPFLEDPTGNRIGRAFEVDGFTRAPEPQTDSTPFTLPFTIAPGTN